MSIDVLKKNLADIRSEINVQQAMLNVTISEIDRKKQEINKLLKKNGQLELASIVYGQAGKQARESARIIFEQIVTNALQYITQNKDYKFIIEESTTRSKPSYEFYVESIVNGEICRQTPKDSGPGGFVDIISTSAKYAYNLIFDDPKIMSSLIILDEPGKMISEAMSIMFAKFIKFLGTKYHRQTLMITHNTNLSNIADNLLVFTKDKSEVSHVSLPIDIETDNLKESIEKILE